MPTDRKVLKAWQDHPLRRIVKAASQGELVRPDTLDRLQLPPEIRKATEQAIARVRPDPQTGRRVSNWGSNAPDSLSLNLVESLARRFPEWETPTENRLRQASEGDAEALASLKAEEEGLQRIVDKVMGAGS